MPPGEVIPKRVEFLNRQKFRRAIRQKTVAIEKPSGTARA
jgi:hypothetical protein